MPTDGAIVLKVENLSKRFGGLAALTDYRLDLGRDDVLGLIGPNGAGKTTAFNLLTGVLAPSGGRIRLIDDGRTDGIGGDTDLTGLGPESFARAGIARTFQNIRLFRDLTVWENVAVGLHMRQGAGWLATILGLPSAARRERDIRHRSGVLLDRVGLADMVDRRAGDLPYGLQRKVEIARALATQPKVLLLDEPAAGMNPSETAGLTETLRGLSASLGSDAAAPTLVVVEHDMKLVMSLCNRVQVLNRGLLIADGAPGEVQRHEDVIAAYLGTGRRDRRRRKHDRVGPDPSTGGRAEREGHHHAHA